MSSSEEKDRFNRRLGLFIGIFALLSWSTTFGYVLTTGDTERSPALFLLPALLLWALFLGVVRSGDPMDKTKRRFWVATVLSLFAALEGLGLFFVALKPW